MLNELTAGYKTPPELESLYSQMTHPLKTESFRGRGFGKMGPVPDGESSREEIAFR